MTLRVNQRDNQELAKDAGHQADYFSGGNGRGCAPAVFAVVCAGREHYRQKSPFGVQHQVLGKAVFVQDGRDGPTLDRLFEEWVTALPAKRDTKKRAKFPRVSKPGFALGNGRS